MAGCPVRLPPGDDGPPLVGETLRFIHDVFGFVHERARKHGSVFRSRILGRRTAVLSGPDALDVFVDSARVQRSGAMPPNIQALFGGESLPVLDGEVHRERKSHVMAAFTDEALDAYVRPLQRSTRAMLGSFEGVVRTQAEFQKLAIEAICEIIMGFKPGPELDAVRRDYETVVQAVASLPLPLPWSAFARGKGAVARILARYAKAISEHKAAPSSDGLSRILASRYQGRAIADDALARELHHIVIAGYIVWGWFCTAVIELATHPELRAKLTVEAATLPANYTVANLEALPELRAASMEVRRVSPVVPVSFGIARTTFELAGKDVPRGWMVLWSPSASNRDAVFTEPETFDEARFTAPRHEENRHPHAFAPNGGGDVQHGHKCAGHALATTMLQVFMVELLRGFDFALVGERPAYDTSKIPAEPIGGLPVRFTAK